MYNRHTEEEKAFILKYGPLMNDETLTRLFNMQFAKKYDVEAVKKLRQRLGVKKQRGR